LDGGFNASTDVITEFLGSSLDFFPDITESVSDIARFSNLISNDDFDEIFVDNHDDFFTGLDQGLSQVLQVSNNFSFVFFQDLQDIFAHFGVDFAGSRFHLSPNVVPCVSVILESTEENLGFSSGCFEGVSDRVLLIDLGLDLGDHDVQNCFHFSPFVSESNQVHDFSDTVGEFLDTSSHHVNSFHDDGTNNGFELSDGSTHDLLDGGQVQVGQVGYLQGLGQLVDDTLSVFLDHISWDDSTGDLLHGIQPVHEFLQDLGGNLRVYVSGDLDDGSVIENNGTVGHVYVGEGRQDSLVEGCRLIGEFHNGVDEGFVGLSYGIVEGFRCFC